MARAASIVAAVDRLDAGVGAGEDRRDRQDHERRERRDGPLDDADERDEQQDEAERGQGTRGAGDADRELAPAPVCPMK